MPNSPKPGTATRSFRAPNTLWARVQATAGFEDIEPSEVVRRALNAYCDPAYTRTPYAGMTWQQVAHELGAEDQACSVEELDTEWAEEEFETEARAILDD